MTPHEDGRRKYLDRGVAGPAIVCFRRRMELRDTYAWRIANLYVMAFILLCVLICLFPSRPVWFGLITAKQMQLLLGVAAGVAVNLLTKKYVKAIETYNPNTQIQAKRANEQIKFTANFGNTIATAWISIMVLGQIIKSDKVNYYDAVFAIMVSIMIHAGSRNMVALIKDENITAA